MGKTRKDRPPKEQELDYNVRPFTRADAGFGGAYTAARKKAIGQGEPYVPQRVRSFRFRPPRRSPVGSSPGELLELESEGETTIDVIAWDGNAVVEWRANHPIEAFDALKKWQYVWVNVKGNSDRGVYTALRDVFELHPLAVEDVWNTPQRPKFEVYPNHLFMVLDCLTLCPRGVGSETFARSPHEPPLDAEQVGLFLGNRFVISIQEKDSDLAEPIRRRFLGPDGRMKTRTVDYVAYAIVDTIVDSWFPSVDFIAERVETMEDEILVRRKRGVVEKLLLYRQRLHEMRRMVVPLHEAVSGLFQTESALVTKGTKVYLRDCLDHASRLLEMSETARDHASGLLDVHIALSSHEMNEVMKVLTLISTIFIPLSFIAGVYGMNFDPEISPWNMPELSWFYGYPFALLLMLGVAGGFVLYFHRRRWL